MSTHSDPFSEESVKEAVEKHQQSASLSAEEGLQAASSPMSDFTIDTSTLSASPPSSPKPQPSPSATAVDAYQQEKVEEEIAGSGDGVWKQHRWGNNDDAPARGMGSPSPTAATNIGNESLAMAPLNDNYNDANASPTRNASMTPLNSNTASFAGIQVSSAAGIYIRSSDASESFAIQRNALSPPALYNPSATPSSTPPKAAAGDSEGSTATTTTIKKEEGMGAAEEGSENSPSIAELIFAQFNDASIPAHIQAMRPRGLSRCPSDLPPIHNASKLIPCQQINSVSEVLEKDFPPPLKKNAVVPTTLPSEMLMPIQLRCDFCQKFDSICSNCNRKWKGILDTRKVTLMNNIKPMQHIRKMCIYFGTILYGAAPPLPISTNVQTSPTTSAETGRQISGAGTSNAHAADTEFLQALITSQPQLTNWCSRIGPSLVPKGQPAEVQLKVADEKGRLFGLHVAMAFGKLSAAKCLLENGSAFRRCDSKKYPTEFLPNPMPDDWDDMLQLQQPFIEFKMSERARNLRREHDYESAGLEYSALLSLNPNSEHAHCGIAKMLFDQGRYEECIAQCQCIIDIEREAARVAAGGGPAAAPKKPPTPASTPVSTATSAAPSPAREASVAATSSSSAAAAVGGASSEGGDAANNNNSSFTVAPPPLVVSSADVEVVGGIHWAEFGLGTIQELQKQANRLFHERCHSEVVGPALKKCGCIVTTRTRIKLRALPWRIIKEHIIPFCDCSMLWGWWRATQMPLLRNVLERSGAVLCDASIGEMLSQERGYSQMYEQISADKPDVPASPKNGAATTAQQAKALQNAVLWNPLRFVGLQVKAMADFNTFVIKSAVAGTNPNFKEPDTSVFFPKARKPMEKLRRVVAVKEFFVHRQAVGGEWKISSAGEWEVDEAASMTLQLDIQRKLESEEKLRAAAIAAAAVKK